MVVGRSVSQSSYPRYLLKLTARFQAIAQAGAMEDTKNPSPTAQVPSLITGQAVANNWLNGFYVYSRVRYLILPILDKYGINRALAYMFMAFATHAYKQLVVKHPSKPNTSPDEVIKRFYNQMGGDSGFISVENGTLMDVLVDILNAIGIKYTPGTVPV